MIVLKRSLIFVHRWMGVALSLVFLMWFVSGIVMMYWDFPSVSAADRLARSAPLDPTTIKLSAQEAFAKSDLDQPLVGVRLNTFDGRPVYRFRVGRGETIVYADDGTQEIEVPEAMLGRIASAWTGQPLANATKESVEEVDQWTVQESLRDLRPLWKFSWPDGQQVYVSGDSGEVVQYTTSASRFWAYLGAVPHWMYFTRLRKNGAEWSQVVMWSSGVATVAALLGITIGVWMYSPRKRYRYAGAPTAIPYRGQKRWHTIFGLIFGLTASTWAFSGLLSMDPFPRERRRPPGANIAGSLRGARLDLPSYGRKHPRDAVAAVSSFGVKELELTSFAGEPVYLASDAARHSRIVPVSGELLEAFDTQRIIEIVTKAAGSSLAEVRVMDEYDAYYLDRTGRRPLPVVYARLNDSGNTRYYIDPKTGRVAASYSSRGWVNRWLYHGLHSMDFPWLYKYRPLWDIVVITFIAGGTALCVTSLILAWRVLKKKLVTRVAVNEDLVVESMQHF